VARDELTVKYSDNNDAAMDDCFSDVSPSSRRFLMKHASKDWSSLPALPISPIDEDDADHHNRQQQSRPPPSSLLVELTPEDSPLVCSERLSSSSISMTEEGVVPLLPNLESL